ncbi:MAG: class III cytochrome C family protein [Rhodospirillales bacterium]|nr:class III cytochrome C family protein [Rhodospirillales bacterium]
MRWQAFAWLLLAAATIAGAGAVTATVWRQGSGAVPRWAAFVKPGELSARHAFLSDKCEACHTPARGVEAVTCISCHATNAATLARESTAFHATVQSCTACHVEHEGGVRPVRMDHEALMAIGRASRPQATFHWFSHLEGSQPTDSLDCFTCHSNRSPHRDLFGRECAACHLTETWKVAGFKHPSPSSTECAQCHQAPPSHYMHHFEMVSMMVAGQHHARVEQCYLCHQTDAWNDIRGVGWYKHH